ncbi:MAG: NAD/NADP octopine/nopaline dehydrogenase family protein [Lactobacillales bacterium]|jgi:opine dehydrogenase|nr:NAD/NADP octopine/nopaline dehydrogenase family protein [Lactobacillales bacterium]
METIAILGGGNAAHAAAAHFSLKGYTIKMFEDAKYASSMQKVFNTKQIKLSGVMGEGTAGISLITSDIKEALKDVKLVILAVPAFAHKFYADLLSDHLQKGQILFIFAGTMGGLVIWNELKKKNRQHGIIIAEAYTSAFDARLSAPGEVTILGTHDPLMTGVMPGKKTDEAISFLKEFFPVTPAESVVDSGLYSLNPVVHTPGCIMNAGRIEYAKGEFWFYKEGITPCVGRVTEALDEERMNIIKKLGYKAVSVVDSLNSKGSSNKNIYEAITGNPNFAKIKGPDGIKNRYFTEDIPFGIVPWALLGDMLGINTPVMDSIITIGNLILQQNTYETGRKLSDMGINENMSLDTLKKYLYEG